MSNRNFAILICKYTANKRKKERKRMDSMSMTFVICISTLDEKRNFYAYVCEFVCAEQQPSRVLLSHEIQNEKILP